MPFLHFKKGLLIFEYVILIGPIMLKKNSLILFLLISTTFVALLFYENGKYPKHDFIGPNLGQYAPNFETEYLNGEKFVLYDLRGTPVVLNFWATWCPPCVREMPALQKLYEENNGKIIVVGVNMQENKGTIDKFLNRRVNVTYPIVLDKDGKIIESYNIIVKPTTFFIDKNGMIADKKLGELSEKEIRERAAKLLE